MDKDLEILVYYPNVWKLVMSSFLCSLRSYFLVPIMEAVLLSAGLSSDQEIRTRFSVLNFD